MKLIISFMCLLLPSSLTMVETKLDLARYKEIYCVVENAYYEARSEGEYGMRLVSMVVRNRARKKGVSFCEVVYAPKQFSWTSSKSLPKMPESFVYRFWSVAENVVDGLPIVRKEHEHVYYFHATYVKPYWISSVKEVVAHRKHIFYSD